MAGVCGTPLPKKLGLQEKFRVAFVGLPAGMQLELRDVLSGFSVVKQWPAGFRDGVREEANGFDVEIASLVHQNS